MDSRQSTPWRSWWCTLWGSSPEDWCWRNSCGQADRRRRAVFATLSKDSERSRGIESNRVEILGPLAQRTHNSPFVITIHLCFSNIQNHVVLDLSYMLQFLA